MYDENGEPSEAMVTDWQIHLDHADGAEDLPDAPPTGVLVIVDGGILAYAGTDVDRALKIGRDGGGLVLVAPILEDFRDQPPTRLVTDMGEAPFPGLHSVPLPPEAREAPPVTPGTPGALTGAGLPLRVPAPDGGAIPLVREWSLRPMPGALAGNQPETARCDWCSNPAVTNWREGRGTGHSERVYACSDHRERQYA